MTTKTAADIATALRAAKTGGGNAIRKAVLDRLPRGVTFTYGQNFYTNAPEWHLQHLCCGEPINVKVAHGVNAIANAAAAAVEHAVTRHGFNPDAREAEAAKPQVRRPARCEECRTILTAFDLEASPVTHLCFNCA